MILLASILIQMAYAKSEFPVIHRHDPKIISVMVIDTGIGKNDLLKYHVKYDKSDNYNDVIKHGTHVTGIIVFGNKNMGDSSEENQFDISDSVCEEVRISSCKFYIEEERQSNSVKKVVECLEKAKAQNIDVVNMSGGGNDFSMKEYQAIGEFVHNQGMLVVAIGNEKSDLKKHPYYPASYSDMLFWPLTLTVHKDKNVEEKTYELTKIPDVYVVEATDLFGRVLPSSNFFKGAIRENGQNILSTWPNNQFGSMTGSSMAAPAYLHKVLKYNCRRLEGSFFYGIKRDR